MIRGIIFILLALILSTSADARRKPKLKTMPDMDEIVSTDVKSLLAIPDSLLLGDYALNDWKERIILRNLNIEDTVIRWPPFINFCLKAYRWADRTFNSRDTNYVKDSGPPGKVILVSDNWIDDFTFVPRDIPDMRLNGELYSNLGIQLKYSILSIGYSFDINTVLSHKKNRHKKWNLALTCARFHIEANAWRSDGATFVRRFGDFNDGKLIRIPFDGLDFRALDIHALYFFNSERFSMGAAYNYSGDQRISAGTWILGPSIYRYRADIDFSQLPDAINDFHPYPISNYRFDFFSYNISWGYSYNWVVNNHITMNATLVPGVGVTITHQKDTYGRRTIPAFGVKALAAMLYTYKRFFASIKANFTGNFYNTHDIRFFSDIQNYQAAIGVRF